MAIIPVFAAALSVVGGIVVAGAWPPVTQPPVLQTGVGHGDPAAAFLVRARRQEAKAHEPIRHATDACERKAGYRRRHMPLHTRSFSVGIK